MNTHETEPEIYIKKKKREKECNQKQLKGLRMFQCGLCRNVWGEFVQEFGGGSIALHSSRC